MVRRTFFSFHYDQDIWRSTIVRNSWVTQDREAAGFWDASLWEDAKRRGDDAIRKLIDNGLKNTSVTVVLIGSQTAGRKWIDYEIIESYNKKKGLLGVYIHNIRDSSRNIDSRGINPFDCIYIGSEENKTLFSQLYPTYDYVNNDGYNNLGYWIESAAQKAGR